MKNKFKVLLLVMVISIGMTGCKAEYLEITGIDAISGEQSTTTDFTATYSVKSDTSKSVYFWVKNNGKFSIVISIDDKTNKTLAPGEDGSITTPSSANTNYNFKVNPTPNGGDINIEYEIGLIDSEKNHLQGW